MPFQTRKNALFNCRYLDYGCTDVLTRKSLPVTFLPISKNLLRMSSFTLCKNWNKLKLVVLVFVWGESYCYWMHVKTTESDCFQLTSQSTEQSIHTNNLLLTTNRLRRGQGTVETSVTTNINQSQDITHLGWSKACFFSSALLENWWLDPFVCRNRCLF